MRQQEDMTAYRGNPGMRNTRGAWGTRQNNLRDDPITIDIHQHSCQMPPEDLMKPKQPSKRQDLICGTKFEEEVSTMKIENTERIIPQSQKVINKNPSPKQMIIA